MKIRKGFVSNSSSTAFIINMEKMPQALIDKISSLNDLSFDLSRCTGKITDMNGWLQEITDGYEDHPIAAMVRPHIGNPNVIIIRESDEQMGGYFSDYGFNQKDIDPYVISQFEYH
jgi:hypothetical protein